MSVIVTAATPQGHEGLQRHPVLTGGLRVGLVVVHGPRQRADQRRHGGVSWAEPAVGLERFDGRFDGLDVGH